MRSLVVSLGCGLAIASFMLNQIHLATATCTNITGLIEGLLMVPDGYGEPPYLEETLLDFISCPSSSNTSCDLSPKTYTVSAAPQLSMAIVTNSSFDFDPDSTNWTALRALERTSNVIDLPLNSPDYRAIFEYAQDSWDPSNQSLTLIDSTLTFTVNTKDIPYYEENDRMFFKDGNLTVSPGHNITLSYVPLMATTWVRFAECDNKTLDGNLIELRSPYIWWNPNLTELEVKAKGGLVVRRMRLNDTVPDTGTKDGSGVGLEAGNVWTFALIVLGALAFNWL